MARAGNLDIKVALQLAEMQTQINQVSQKLESATSKWSSDMKKFGTTTANVFKGSFLADAALQAVNTISAAIRDTITEVDKLAKSAKNAGVDFQTWQVWERVAQNAGVGIETVSGAMDGLNKTLGQINAGGGKNAAAALDRIGLSAKELQKMNPGDALRTLVEALGNVKSPADQAALAAATIGTQWKALTPIISDASGAFVQAEEDMKKFGLGVTDEAAGAITEFEKAVGTMQTAMRDALANGIAPFLAALTPFIQYLTKADESTGLLDATLSALVITFKGVVIAVTAVVSTFKALGSIVSGAAQLVGIAIGKIATDLGTLKDLFTGQISVAEALGKFGANTEQALGDMADTIKSSWGDATTALDAGREAIAAIATSAPKAGVAVQQAFEPLPAVIKPVKEHAEKTAKAIKAVKDESENLRKAIADQQRELEAAQARAAGASEDEVRAILVKGKAYADLELQLLQLRDATKDYNDLASQMATDTADLVKAQNDFADAMGKANGMTDEQILRARALAEGWSDARLQAELTRKDLEAWNASREDEKKRNEEVKEFWTDFGNLAGKAIADVATGTKSATEAMKAFVIQLAAAVIQAQLLKALGLGSGVPALGSVGAAKGATFGPGGLAMFAQGGIFNSPTAFRYGGGRTGVLGEAGPEAVMPLTRIGGKLGVMASGGSKVEVHNYGAQVDVQSDHDRTKIIVKAVRDSLASDVLRGGNPFATAMERTYGVRR